MHLFGNFLLSLANTDACHIKGWKVPCASVRKLKYLSFSATVDSTHNAAVQLIQKVPLQLQ